MSFQELIEGLNTFWAKQGCLIGQPYGVEVGAGTANPHTFFRVLGPEPYNVAYVEPSRRPTDGRYGQSPNRFQHYFQYQVILKPAPKFNQELFIESLITMGLDPRKHDIRFVEDNWESTPLGAWGLGWEVWCDGMEVAQYTYFQQMAGIPLEVPTLEITYGLERLAMYIQDVDHYKDMKWNDTTTYADIFERHEYWQAKHNFETSTPATLQTLFTTYETEVQTQITLKNYWAAYDYLLKVSHLFNLLEARGMISVSDRVAKFGMMGKATKAIGTMYLDEREVLGFPLKGRMAPIQYHPTVLKAVPPSKAKYQKNIAIVELGFEELPVGYLIEWSELLTHNWFKQQLKDRGVTYRKAYLYMTPRRIVMKIVQPSKQGRVVQTLKGPATQIAYDEKGKPTAVLEGYLRSKSLKIKELKIKEENGKQFVAAEKEVVKTLAEVFQEISEQIIASAPKTRWMVWEQGIPAFIRPLRWILAYHNDKKLQISLMNISTGKSSPLPRYELPAEKEISSAQQYLQFIRESGIILSQRKRARRIAKESAKPGVKIGKFDDMVVKNSFLTENPHALGLELEKKYAELPIELITLILEKNQMYPMTQEKSGELYYHVVANHRRVHKRIAYGNQKVARARLDDGVFYFEQDSKKKLAEYEEGLKQIGFHPKAGTYYDKKQRIQKRVESLYQELGKKTPPQLTGALKLVKNDKATSLGKEFPSLEGVIGKTYAIREGIDKKVADLLAEHYLPLEPGGKLPATEEGIVLSLVDKLDSLITLSQVEKLPEGSHDPFEIRKTVYRLLTLLTKSTLHFESSDLSSELYAFIAKRFQQLLEEEQIPQWIARGVALSSSRDFGEKYRYAYNLADSAKTDEDKELILDTLKRVKNILGQKEAIVGEAKTYGSDKPLEPVEQELKTFVDTHEKEGIAPHKLVALAHILERYFRAIMVLDKEEAIRNRRVAAMQALQQLLEQNFSLTFS